MAKSKNSLLYEKMILENLARPFLQITGVRAAYLLERRSTRSSFTRYCITRPRKLPPPAISSALPPNCNTSTSKSPPNKRPTALHFPLTRSYVTTDSLSLRYHLLRCCCTSHRIQTASTHDLRYNETPM